MARMEPSDVQLRVTTEDLHLMVPGGIEKWGCEQHTAGRWTQRTHREGKAGRPTKYFEIEDLCVENIREWWGQTGEEDTPYRVLWYTRKGRAPRTTSQPFRLADDDDDAGEEIAAVAPLPSAPSNGRTAPPGANGHGARAVGVTAPAPPVMPMHPAYLAARDSSPLELFWAMWQLVSQENERRSREFVALMDARVSFAREDARVSIERERSAAAAESDRLQRHYQALNEVQAKAAELASSASDPDRAEELNELADALQALNERIESLSTGEQPSLGDQLLLKALEIGGPALIKKFAGMDVAGAGDAIANAGGFVAAVEEHGADAV